MEGPQFVFELDIQIMVISQAQCCRRETSEHRLTSTCCCAFFLPQPSLSLPLSLSLSLFLYRLGWFVHIFAPLWILLYSSISSSFPVNLVSRLLFHSSGGPVARTKCACKPQMRTQTRLQKGSHHLHVTCLLLDVLVRIFWQEFGTSPAVSVKGVLDPPTILNEHNTVGAWICHWPTMSAASHPDLFLRPPPQLQAHPGFGKQVIKHVWKLWDSVWDSSGWGEDTSLICLN